MHLPPPPAARGTAETLFTVSFFSTHSQAHTGIAHVGKKQTIVFYCDLSPTLKGHPARFTTLFLFQVSQQVLSWGPMAAKKRDKDGKVAKHALDKDRSNKEVGYMRSAATVRCFSFVF